MVKPGGIVAGAVLSAVVCGAAFAADAYPNRPVRMIVPFAPGGASDFVGRIVQPAMADLLKQTVVVDNRPGAAGNIGVETAVRASPDGYTFLLGNVGTMAINPVDFTAFVKSETERFGKVIRDAKIPTQ